MYMIQKITKQKSNRSRTEPKKNYLALKRKSIDCFKAKYGMEPKYTVYSNIHLYDIARFLR